MGKSKKKKRPQIAEPKPEPEPKQQRALQSRKRKLWLALPLLLLGIFAVAYFQTRKQNYAFGAFKGYNVLLITLDTTRADHLPVYGYKQVETPGLDKIGKSSLIFEDAITQAPLTLPSHVSILSGTMPIWHGVRDNAGYVLDPKVKTLATALKSKGYNTAA